MELGAPRFGMRGLSRAYEKAGDEAHTGLVVGGNCGKMSDERVRFNTRPHSPPPQPAHLEPTLRPHQRKL